MNPSPNLRVAALQTGLTWEDGQANIDRIQGHLNRLTTSADLIVLPEMWATGFTMNPGEFGSVLARRWEDEERSWPAPLTAMRSWAIKHDAAVIGSLSCRVEGATGGAVNRCFFVPPTGRVQFYDKRHLFGFAGEPAAYSPGADCVVVDWRGWRILLQVCYDLRFPVFSRNHDANPYDAAVYVANWPDVRVEAWGKLLLARAIENQCYVVGVNRVGEDGNGIAHSGHSALIDAYGNVTAALPPSEEGWIYAEWDRNEIERYREKFPVLRDADRFTLP